MKKQICDNCKYYRARYGLGSTGYIRIRDGVCGKYNRAGERFGVCDDWVSDGVKWETRKKACLETLQEMAEHLDMIMQILREESEKSKT